MSDYDSNIKLTAQQKRLLTAIGAILVAILGLFAVLTDSPPDQTPTPPAPTAPAPLPPNTGVDGAGDDGDGTEVTTPDAGAGAAITVEPGPSEGEGDYVYVRTLALDHGRSEVRLNAGWEYSNGSAHRAWDLGVWRGTPVYAPRAAWVVGRNNGVPNDLGGATSNWVLLCRNVPNIGATLAYFQHLSPGYIISRGLVASGGLLGLSGNSGHSSGDHLHYASGRSPQSCASITQARAEAIRYDYLNDHSTTVYAPSRFEYQPPAPLPVVGLREVWRACTPPYAQARAVAWGRVAFGQRPEGGLCTPWFVARYNQFRTSRGLTHPTIKVLPDCRSLDVLGHATAHQFRIDCRAP